MGSFHRADAEFGFGAVRLPSLHLAGFASRNYHRILNRERLGRTQSWFAIWGTDLIAAVGLAIYMAIVLIIF
jgi:hypothetical protein